MDSSSFAIEPLTPALGAMIRGVDVKTMNADTFDALRAAWLDYKVLFVADQNLTASDLCRFGERFGALMRLPYIEPMADYPEVIRVLKAADEDAGGVFGGEWHTDFSFLASPPAASLLYAVELPPVGGDTLWADMAIAWQRLPREIQDQLIGLSAVHTGAPYGRAHAPATETRSGASIRIERDNPEADEERFHPAVVAHPQTGEWILNVNPTYTTRIAGLEAEESKRLLDTLYRHCVRPEFCCRYRWRPNSLAIWDNRSTMHYAIDDYSGYRRELMRVTTRGEPPRAAAPAG